MMQYVGYLSLLTETQIIGPTRLKNKNSARPRPTQATPPLPATEHTSHEISKKSRAGSQLQLLGGSKRQGGNCNSRRVSQNNRRVFLCSLFVPVWSPRPSDRDRPRAIWGVDSIRSPSQTDEEEHSSHNKAIHGDEQPHCPKRCRPLCTEGACYGTAVCFACLFDGLLFLRRLLCKRVCSGGAEIGAEDFFTYLRDVTWKVSKQEPKISWKYRRKIRKTKISWFLRYNNLILV